ncbi:hypothetical protein [Streptomyces sp. NPDC003077]
MTRVPGHVARQRRVVAGFFVGSALLFALLLLTAVALVLTSL